MSPTQKTDNTTGVKPTVANKASTSNPREVKNISASKAPENPVNSEAEEIVAERDILTGRILAEDGESCLRCIDKGLKCTLIFLGFENEAKCAACRRSGSQYCIRQRRPQDCYMFYGHPWNSPNYFAVGRGPNSREMEEILEEHFLGKIIDSIGAYTYIYIYGRKQHSMTLPPFNGSDLPAAIRPEDFKSKTWKDVLPISMNKSAHRRLEDNIADEGKSAEQKAEEQESVLEALMAPLLMFNSPEFVPRKVKEERRLRYYPIRAMHLSEYLANGGEMSDVQKAAME
ncbi:hypothetical protein F4813DRAFT_368335 [Daldinia decipiens]|uniref:uncharacterized protein n=1 Tax=Daldinia decipiens TaxID=326647 RepID=UPI0020C2C91A|nr:uncharacterized protein F4813DRAFT_368335 [Daldinia decipiens]KAI1655015.1 hypothetical protein F4813DRAFT_368335 [Daldinia decipiens]